RRRLAGAVGSEESEHSAARHAKRQVVDGDDFFVLLCEVGRFDDVLDVRRGHTANPIRHSPSTTVPRSVAVALRGWWWRPRAAGDPGAHHREDLLKLADP